MSSTGVAKRLALKIESAWNTAPGATGAQILRRTSSDLNLAKDTYQSNEIRSDYQISDYRHGTRRVEGTIAGELSCASYQMLMAAALRASQTWTVAPSSGAQTDVTAAVTVAPAGSFTTVGGDWLVDGFRIGMITRWTGWTAGATANNSRNFLITNLTDKVMTGIFLDGTAVVAKASGDSVTVTGFKSVYVPTTGHSNDSFAVEHWHSDVTESELFTGCKVNTMGIALPASGLATIDFGMLGGNVTTDTSAYYTTPTAAGTTGVLAAANGAIYVGTTKIGVISGININLAGGMTTTPVVGSNSTPAVFPGRVNVTGDVSAYFDGGTLRDLFIDETPATIIVALSAGNNATDDVMTVVLPRVKFGSATKNDNESALQQQLSFQAIIAPSTLTGHHPTTIMINDTAAV